MKAREILSGRDYKHKKRDSSHGKFTERIYKMIMIFGLGVAYKGFKGWLKSKKNKVGY